MAAFLYGLYWHHFWFVKFVKSGKSASNFFPILNIVGQWCVAIATKMANVTKLFDK